MANTPLKLSVRYWEGHTFPEIDDAELAYTPLASRPNTGIALSGGGTISVSLIAGYLKALTELGLMKRVRYLSGVSGGAWGSIPYCYLPDSATLTRFLGPKYMPEDLSVRKLRWNRKGSLVRTVTHAQIANRTLINGRFAHDAFSRAVGEIFLRPIDIPSPPPRGERARFFTTTPEAANTLVHRNSALKAEDFLTLRTGAPYPIVNGVMFVPKTEESTNRDDFHVLPMEFTPLYSGTHVGHPHRGKDNQVVGGSWIESAGFNGTPTGPLPQNGLAEVSVDRPFELADSLGTSGAAIAKLLVEFNIKLKLLFPQYSYWNPAAPQSAQSYEFGDSGVLENLGIIPLLTRKVENIVVLSTEPFDTQTPLRNWDPSERAERQFGYNQIAALFGQPIYDLDPRSKTYLKFIDPEPHRQVFAKEEFAQVKEGLIQSKANGGPCHFKGTLTVVENEFYGIDGGWEAQILWMCVDTAKKWENRLPPRIQRRLGRLGSLDSFPVVRIFGQNPPHVIQLNRLQANLLGNLAYWMVMDRRQELTDLLGKSTNS